MAKIGDKSYKAERAKLRIWLTLEDIKSQLLEAVERRDRLSVAEALCLYVSTAFSISNKETKDAYWMEIALAFAEIQLSNEIAINELTFVRSKPKPSQKEDAWEYDGRIWWVWAQTFAKEFGWELDKIANLDVEDAFHLFQEILVNEQLQREWEWGLSDKSATYDATTKKVKPNPLTRPDWMKMTTKAPPPIKTVRIRKDMMPIGEGVRYAPPTKST